MGNTASLLIETKKFNLIIDTGYGIGKLDQYIDYRKTTHLFISHLHLDHIVGLHTLAKFKFKKPLKIFVLKGMKNK